jgi:uncharacterized membrane protein HdeD (DUF308 family)
MRIDIPEDETGEASRGWWLFLLVGGASVIAGAILVAKPGNSLAALAVIVGIFLLVDSIAELAASLLRGGENRALGAILGVLGIIAGLVLIRHPTSVVSAIGLLIGLWLVAAGVIRLMRAFMLGGHVVLRGAVALLEIGVGVAVIAEPHIGYATLAVLVGLGLIVNGIGTIGLGMAVRPGATDRGRSSSARTRVAHGR